MIFSTFDLSKLIRQYCSVRRFSTIYTAKDENIAEHSASLALMCLLIYDEITSTSKLHGFDLYKDININLVIRAAVIHDCDEIITGDIPRPTKHFHPEMKSACNIVKKRAIENLVRCFGISMNGIEYESFLNDSEKQYLKYIDFLSVLYKVYWEIQLGNKDILDLLPELESYCQKIRESKLGSYIYDNYMKLLISNLSDCKSEIKLNFRLQ